MENLILLRVMWWMLAPLFFWIRAHLCAIRTAMNFPVISFLYISLYSKKEHDKHFNINNSQSCEIMDFVRSYFLFMERYLFKIMDFLALKQFHLFCFSIWPNLFLKCSTFNWIWSRWRLWGLFLDKTDFLKFSWVFLNSLKFLASFLFYWMKLTPSNVFN